MKKSKRRGFFNFPGVGVGIVEVDNVIGRAVTVVIDMGTVVEIGLTVVDVVVVVGDLIESDGVAGNRVVACL